MKNKYLNGICILLISIIYMNFFINCNHKTEENQKTETEPTFEELVAYGDFPVAKTILSKELINVDIYNIDKVYDKADLLYRDWILDILASDENNKQAKIIQLCGEYPIIGNKKEGLQFYDFKDRDDGGYSKGSSHYNQLCDKILNSAILMKNYEIANDIIELYMQDPEITNGSFKTNIIIDGKKIDGNHSYVKYTWKSKEAAKKKLNEVKKNK